MAQSETPLKPMTRAAMLEHLLDELCVDLGFCLPRRERARLSNTPPNSVEAFTDAVFNAEGLNSEIADKDLWRQVRDRVARCFRVIESNDVV